MDRTDLIRPQSLELDNHSNTNFCMDREPPVSEIAIDGPGPFRLNSTLAGYEKVYSSQASSRPQNHPSPNSAHETSLFGSIHHELRRGSVSYQTEGPTKLQPNQLGITEMSTSENSFECFEINNNSFSELMDIMEIPCGSEMDEVVYGNRLKDALPGSSTPNSCSFQSSDWYQENEFPGYPHDIPYLDMPERTGTEEEDVPPCCNCGLRDASNTPYDPTGDWFCETCRPCSGEIAMDGLSAKLFQCLWPGCDKVSIEIETAMGIQLTPLCRAFHQRLV
jgi:hypothetical protein